ncbi:TIGR03790 family protein [Duganella sp. Dugasp56]|uniref:TIGR03790 family protein n=1 Tax=Duganella sp. Dugasp56 TaxID=3243046 RepID=UPI0039B0D081
MRTLLFLAALLSCCAARAQMIRPQSGSELRAAQLGLVINDDDPRSVEIGEYYRTTREVPAQNVVHVHIPNRPRKLDAEQFRQLKAQIDAGLGPQVQAVLMVWTAPYAVECNSITSAFTLGLDVGLCQKPCGPGKPSSYFNAPGGQPFRDYQMRLSMLLPTESVEGAKALIGRGMVGGFSVPAATAWYLVTSETPRNSRAPFFPPSGTVASKKLTIKNLRADSIEGQGDIMIYQTGMARVAKLDTLQFLPGALADHLTSTGGDLLSDGQMSSLRWLDAGATASYGSVTEPCNYWQKFPQPTVLLRHYLAGETAIEAYWKSVAWPAQGVFIGEPLAAPYRR